MADVMPPQAASTGGRKPSSVWLIIFTDLVALLLTFFVMLFSMSNVQIDRWKEMIDAGSEAAAKEKGLIRLEGKDYIVQDGDVCNFRFNVYNINKIQI